MPAPHDPSQDVQLICDAIDFLASKKISTLLRAHSELPPAQKLLEAKDLSSALHHLDSLIRLKLRSDLQAANTLRSVGGATLPEEQIRKRLGQIAQSGHSRYYIYGAGTHTEALWDLFESELPAIAGIIDRSPSKALFHGAPILHPDQVDLQEGEAVILSSFSFEDEMKMDCLEHFGPSVESYTLYKHNPLERFNLEVQKERIGQDFNAQQDALMAWLNTHPQGRQLNASGIVLASHKKAAHPQVEEPQYHRLPSQHAEKLQAFLYRSYEASINQALPKIMGKPWFFIDAYQVGPHLNLLIEQISKNCLAAFPDAQIIIGTTEPGEIALPSALQEKVEFICLESLQAIIAVLASSKQVPKFLNQAIKDSPSSMADLLEPCKRGLHQSTQFHQPLLTKLFETSQPLAWINLQDNRPLSAAFHCIRENFPDIPSIQFQHGVLSSTLGPFWSDCYVGWNDKHSKSFIEANSQAEYLPWGYPFLNALEDRAKQYTASPSQNPKRRFVFFFQGPPYHHPTAQLVEHALSCIAATANKLADTWSFEIKLRNASGYGLCHAFLKDAPVTLHRANTDHLDLFANAEAIAVISSGLLIEAEHFGIPCCSFELPECHGIVRFSEHRTSTPIRSPKDLFTFLQALPKAPLPRPLTPQSDEAVSETREKDLVLHLQALCTSPACV